MSMTDGPTVATMSSLSAPTVPINTTAADNNATSEGDSTASTADTTQTGTNATQGDNDDKTTTTTADEESTEGKQSSQLPMEDIYLSYIEPTYDGKKCIN